MSVRAGPAECADARAARASGSPLDTSCRHDERTVLQTQVLVRLFEVQVGRDEIVLEREHGLDDSCHAGGAARVSDVRLDGPERAGVPALAGGSEYRVKRVDFDGIAERRSGPVHLD